MPTPQQNFISTTLLHIVRCALFGENIDTSLFEKLNAEQWKDLYRLSAQQGVLAIAYDVVKTLPKTLQPSREIVISWALSVENIEKRYARQQLVVEKLADLFAKSNIQMMLLKGLGLAQYYPIPQHRECGDVDIYLFGKQKLGDEIVARELNIKVHNDVHHHTVFTCDGVMVENHFDFVNVVSHTSNMHLEKMLKQMSAMSSVPFDVNNVFLPSADLNAIFLMRHAASHFAATEINMRHLIDLMFFFKNNYKDIDFVNLNNVFSELGMCKFANTIEGILIDKFDLNLNVFDKIERNKSLETRVWNDLFNPEFSKKINNKNIFSVVCFKFRRFFSNKWKYKMVYKENFWRSFFQSTYAHLLKPKTIKGINPTELKK